MPVELKAWVGDHVTRTLRRRPDDEPISCKEPEFDEFVCMDQETFDCFYRTYVLRVPCKDDDKGELSWE